MEVSHQPAGKLPTVIRSNGMHLILIGFQQPDHRLTDCGQRFVLNLADQCESRLAFNDAHDGLPVVLADDGIGFPVADLATCFDNDRAIIDREPVRNNAAQFDLAIAFLALLLATQILPQQSTCSIVRINSLIHRFWNDGGVPADLLWTPLLQQPLLTKLPGCIINRQGIYCSAFYRHAVRLFRAITSPSTVTR